MPVLMPVNGSCCGYRVFTSLLLLRLISRILLLIVKICQSRDLGLIAEDYARELLVANGLVST
ncbi:hypothetical protein SAMN05421752_11019 [Natronorubrum thiooxidans]|uniref:Uncharacterized protein n=1 Tax=Natronorubrum thiooxidans TaxID=308853 RepID=A0A1N7G5Y2_9EURY|nr:hypothetical protein SAMN05421752_11019 [Natronorubrum thiooxidans]